MCFQSFKLSVINLVRNTTTQFLLRWRLNFVFYPLVSHLHHKISSKGQVHCKFQDESTGEPLAYTSIVGLFTRNGRWSMSATAFYPAHKTHSVRFPFRISSCISIDYCDLLLRDFLKQIINPILMLPPYVTK